MQNKDEFESQLLDLARVTRVTAGGRRLRFRATVVVGNRAGKVGIGVAKGKDVSEAVEKATTKAKKSLISVPLKNETIPYDIEVKYQSARVFLRPQRKGSGLVVGGAMRTVCELAGVPNITGKLISKTNNKVNIARATLKAFQEIEMRSR